MQVIKDQIECEKKRRVLLELSSENKSVQSTGLAIAQAKAQADADEISIKAEVD